MSNLNSRYIIICEGKSEVAYIQELNKYFREKNISINLVSKPVGGGHYADVVRKYKEEFKKNNEYGFRIWVDKDIYERNEQKNWDKYNKRPKNIPDFCFNIFNFEDFFYTVMTICH
ncbi:MAG: RloB family protein [Endomicrobium sp.]|nr:RloB family protein [Endomicrobium sp.]